LKLFKGIPVEEKKKIEENYIIQKMAPKVILGDYKITIFKGEDDKKRYGDDDLIFDNATDEIRAFLKKHSNAFRLWRYFYEIKTKSRLYLNSFNCFIKAFKLHAISIYEKN
jgi:hypothetical protein